MKKGIYAKLLKVQSNPIIVKRDGSANIPGRKYSYATLDQILEKVIPALNEAGIVLVQRLGFNETHTVVQTTIIDPEDGSSIESEMAFPLGIKAQDAGSYITYFRRYSVAALLGIASEEDDDAASVMPPAKVAAPPRPAPAAPTAPAKPMFRPMLVEFKDKLNKHGFNWLEQDALDAIWDYLDKTCGEVKPETPATERGKEIARVMGVIGVQTMSNRLDTLFKEITGVPDAA